MAAGKEVSIPMTIIPTLKKEMRPVCRMRRSSRSQDGASHVSQLTDEHDPSRGKFSQQPTHGQSREQANNNHGTEPSRYLDWCRAANIERHLADVENLF